MYPRTHSLMTLIRLLSNVASGLEVPFEGKNVVMITKIEDAYIVARCMPRRYEKEEVEEMLKFVKEVFRNVVARI